MNTFHNGLQVRYWFCDTCHKTMCPGEYRFNCTMCNDYDQCETCTSTLDPPHPHQLARYFIYGPVTSGNFAVEDMSTSFRKAFSTYAYRDCMGVRNIDERNPSKYGNSYSWLKYKAVGDRVENFGHGLRQLVDPHGYLGICAENRPEWLIASLACIVQSIIIVPIYCLFTDRELIHVINNTQISIIVCDSKMLPKFLQIAEKCLPLQHIVCMDPISDIILEKQSTSFPSLHYMNNIEKNGLVKKYPYVPMRPDDFFIIMYTSGSTGIPKGAILTEKAYRATFENWSLGVEERVRFCYRSLAWPAEFDGSIGYILLGGRIGFSTGNFNEIIEELALVQPTVFSAPPIFWDKIYSEFKAKFAMLQVEDSLERRGAIEKELLKHFSYLIPTSCKAIVVGSAKVSSTILDFLRKCFIHCDVYESYGITECGGVASDNIFYPSVEYRLESVPELGYTIDDKPFPRGELLAKSKQVFSGYINSPEETRAALTDDGFFRTGDIVELRKISNNHISIHVIDRKKSFFKLSNGQFVSPEFLQSVYIKSPFIEQIYVHGDIRSNCISAVIIPNRAYAETFILGNNLRNFDYRNPDNKFCDAILQDLRAIARKESLRRYEIPFHIIIDFEPFTCENGLLTSSLKHCRHRIAAHYADRLNATQNIDQRLKAIFETTTGRLLSTDDEDNFLMVNGCDSLTAVRLSRTIENNLGITVPLNILFEPAMTLERLTNVIKHPSQLYLQNHSDVSRLFNDCQLDFNISMGKCKTVNATVTKVFITGTTGFVGAFLLNELLRSYPSTCEFFCLVRCQSTVDSFERIRENMLFYQIWNDEYQKQIIPLKGDLAKIQFGLNDETYQKLANEIEIIFHCGAAVNFILPYNQLYGPNVCGTREIIRLATYTSNWIPVHYISTISVLSSNINNETSIDNILPNNLVGGYAQSKWVAEKLINSACQFGLPVRIYRLGSTGPACHSGACNKNSIDTLLLAAIMKIGYYPESQLNIHLNSLPVDYTVKSIVYLSKIQSVKESDKIYHVINSKNYISLEMLVDSFNRSHLQLEKVSTEEWQSKVKQFIYENSSFEPIEEFLLKIDNLPQKYNVSNENFCKRLTSVLNFPNIDNDYVFKWVDFILHHIITT